METLVGLYEQVEFTKITKDSTNVHDKNSTPNAICRGTDTHTR